MSKAAKPNNPAGCPGEGLPFEEALKKLESIVEAMEGDELPLKIIRIEPARHRLGLSLRQVEEEPYEDYADGDGSYTVGDAVDTNGEDAGNLSAYGEQPDAGDVVESEHVDVVNADSSIEAVPTTGQADDDEANAQASSVEPSGARPASIAES